MHMHERCINVKNMGTLMFIYENKYLLYIVSKELRKIQTRGKSNLYNLRNSFANIFPRNGGVALEGFSFFFTNQ